MRNFLPISVLLFFSLGARCQFVQTETFDFPAEARDDAVAFAVGDYLYAGTGLTNFFYVVNDWWRFYYPTKTWEKLDDLPFEARQYMMGFTHKKYIYLFGGWAGNTNYFNDFWRFDAETLEWKQLDSLPGRPRWSGFAFALGDYGYIGGGDDTLPTQKDFYRYSFTTEKWEQLSDLPFGKRMHGIAASDSVKAVLGLGTSDVQEAYTDLYIFNGVSQKFTKLMDFPKPLQRVKSVLRKEGGADILYLFGGQEIGGKYSQKLYKVNIETLAIDSLEITDVPTRRSMNFTNYRNGMALIFGLTNENRFIQTVTLIDQDVLTADNFEFSLYPNPVTENMLAIETSEKVISFSMYSMLGTAVYKKEFDFKTKNQLLYLPSIVGGVYIIICTLESGKAITQKVLVK